METVPHLNSPFTQCTMNVHSKVMGYNSMNVSFAANCNGKPKHTTQSENALKVNYCNYVSPNIPLIFP